jgi:hypothetical protein
MAGPIATDYEPGPLLPDEATLTAMPAGAHMRLIERAIRRIEQRLVDIELTLLSSPQ